MRLVTRPVLALFAVLCAMALAGILVSPAVPSPPTVVGKVVHASVLSLDMTILPPAFALGAILLGVLYLIWQPSERAGDDTRQPVFLPLRR